MKKFELVYFNDCRGISEVYRIRESFFESGLDVVKYVVKEREFEEEGWLESVGDFLSNKDWYKGDNWVSNLVFEGDVNGDVFIVSMNDEFSEVMVLREDNKYFGKFKRDVDVDDKENIELYYEVMELMW